MAGPPRHLWTFTFLISKGGTGGLLAEQQDVQVMPAYYQIYHILWYTMCITHHAQGKRLYMSSFNRHLSVYDWNIRSYHFHQNSTFFSIILCAHFYVDIGKKQDRSFGVAFGHREAALPLGHWKVKCQDYRFLFYFPPDPPSDMYSLDALILEWRYAAAHELAMSWTKSLEWRRRGDLGTY